MTPYEIPLIAGAQTLVVTLAGVDRKLTTRWCAPSGCWVLDISTPQDEPILLGLPLVAGTNLLRQHQHLNLGGELYAQNASDPSRSPEYANLGDEGLVFFVVP